jgi:SAM-dependent methyltransferase
MSCSSCGQVFRPSATGQPDLRLAGPLDVTTLAVLGRPAHPLPPVDLSNPLVSYLPPAPPGALALDLGCGQQPDRPSLERAGYRYEGIDFADPGAPLLADGHRLPYRDGVFDLVWTIAVLEQLRYPDVALSEVRRVLKPRGSFLGNVTWQTPYIAGVHYSWSHVGLNDLLVDHGFEVTALVVDPRWTAVESSLALGYFPKLPVRVAQGVSRPLQSLHRAYWAAAARAGRVHSRAGEDGRVISLAAAIGFVATRGSDRPGG